MSFARTYFSLTHAFTWHTHTHTYIYIYMLPPPPEPTFAHLKLNPLWIWSEQCATATEPSLDLKWAMRNCNWILSGSEVSNVQLYPFGSGVNNIEACACMCDFCTLPHNPFHGSGWVETTTYLSKDICFAYGQAWDCQLWQRFGWAGRKTYLGKGTCLRLITLA